MPGFMANRSPSRFEPRQIAVGHAIQGSSILPVNERRNGSKFRINQDHPVLLTCDTDARDFADFRS